MQLASILEHRFSGTVRKRGEQYFKSHRVQVLAHSEVGLGSLVIGSEPYAVLLTWDTPVLSASCGCAYFRDQGHPCKHLWATILAADAGGYLSEARKASRIDFDTDLLGDDFDAEDFSQSGSPPSRNRAFALQPPPAPPPPPPAWQKHLSRVAELGTASSYSRDTPPPWPPDRQIVYILDTVKSAARQSIVLSVSWRERYKEGSWKVPAKSWLIQRARIASLPIPEDREILSLLVGGGHYSPYSYDAYDPYDRGAEAFNLSFPLAQSLLPLTLRTGRCFLPFEKDTTESTQLRWDEGDPWRFKLTIQGSEAAGWELTGEFRRDVERMDVRHPKLITRGGFLVADDWVAPFVEDEAYPWIAALREDRRILVAESEREQFLNHLLASPHLPALELPESLRFEEVNVTPRPCLTISKPKAAYGADRLNAKVSFEYEGQTLLGTTKASGIYDAANRRFIRRDRTAESAASMALLPHGFRPGNSGTVPETEWTLAPTKLPKAARALAESGWQVVAEGKVFRQPGATSVSVVSGVDWFELQGTVSYGDTVARLPQLLSALKRGETMVTLDDGSYGLLPEEWLRRFANVAVMGDAEGAEGDGVQFRRNQAGLLDALLSAQPTVDCDEQFRQVRRELQRFEAIAPAEQPAGFQGQLREYQREGLGWMHFLRQFHFGGCLADDMGVGKTAQVLALLETRRELRAKGEVNAPSLAVVPKSLIFNWMQEIARFTPQLRVVDYTGIGRTAIDYSACDLILTTYGTLRRDAVQFSEQTFDYIILDEAQAIKNARTESAKAVRLLHGNYRLALSGTPVENHLGELWSLFEFLNPGLLGASGAFQMAAKDMREPSSETRKMLGQALRPFLLRRTKEQVAKELPAKVEQTLYCELEPKQRTLYDELREHYRDSLLAKIDKVGMAKSKIQVLEALLRLRQAACHPGALVDRKRSQDPSAKLDVLLDQVRDVIEEGHKALVFSQFTTLLGFLGTRLQAEGLAYEYLDGKTEDRQVPVERFQNDPACKLFLISLKAGGTGLNLTAADYVFILDPWWNPAVEAQAVDRAHRIGQTRQVFAYRLIARDTVEEKILQLQQNKRNIAEAILSEDNSLIRDLAPEDIALLLS